MIRRVVLVALLLLVGLSSRSQQDQEKTAEKERSAEALKAFAQEAPSQGAERVLEMYGVDAFPCEKETTNDEVHKSCTQARQAYYDYYAKGLTRRTREYEWNNFSTRVIFFVVLSLVAVGVYFSWKQFFGVMLKPPVDGNKTPDKEEQSPITEVKVGLGRIKVKSPVLGVVLLTLSLAFFYLYLRYVYPVTAHF